MGELKGLKRSYEVYADAIKQAGGNPLTITGRMAGKNLEVLKAAGFDVSKTPSAKVLDKLGYTIHELHKVIRNGKTYYYRVSRKPF